MSLDKFKTFVEGEASILTKNINHWQTVVDSEHDLSEDVLGQIYAVIGKTKLLLREKLIQFKELIEQSEHNTGTKEISPNDLEGYQEVVEMQISTVKQSFEHLKRAYEGFKKESTIRPNSSANKKCRLPRSERMVASIILGNIPVGGSTGSSVEATDNPLDKLEEVHASGILKCNPSSKDNRDRTFFVNMDD